MSRYLIFFGKSQSFTFNAYDENAFVQDFDSVIKDFELLESQWLSVDRVDNKNILAKYNFISAGRKFSLLKLYSHAQAAEGNRIDGSIYGVAFLAQENLLVTPSNIKLLQSVKEKFTELSLQNLKFKSSNFEKETRLIWDAFHKQNYFDVIEVSDEIVVAENTNPFAFYVESIFQIPTTVDEYTKDTSRQYFSEDLSHLKRAKEKWGDRFTLFHMTDPKIIAISDLQKASRSNQTETSEHGISRERDLRFKDYETEISHLKSSIKALIQREIKYKSAIASTLVILLMILAFLAYHFIVTDATENKPSVNPSIQLSDSVLDIKARYDSSQKILKTDSTQGTITDDAKKAKIEQIKDQFGKVSKNQKVDTIGVNKKHIDKTK